MMHAKNHVDAELHQEHDHEVRTVITVGDHDVAWTQLPEQLAQQRGLAGLFAGIAAEGGTDHGGRR